MRTKDEILREVRYNQEHRPDGIIEIDLFKELSLEVLIDIRDILDRLYLSSTDLLMEIKNKA